MANNSNEKELKDLRSLVTRLAKTIDYKNLMLIEKDGLLDDKSAEIAVLTAKKKWAEQEMSKAIEEKENMSKERSSAISVLIQQDAEKDMLLQEKSATIAELIKEKEKMAKEISNVESKLKVKEEKMDCDSREIIVEKDRVINENCGVISKLMAEKNQFFDSYLQELEKAKNMKLELEKLNHDLEYQKKETEAARKRLKVKKEQVDHASSTITKLIQQNAHKDRLINEKSTLINNLTTEKNNLSVTYMKGMEKTKSIRLENERLKHDLECEKNELKKLIKEKIDVNKIPENVAVKTRSYSATTEFKDSKVQTEEETIRSIAKIEQVNKVQMLEDLRGQLSSLRNQLEEKEEALHYLEDANKILMVKQVASNQELQAARIAAIQGFESMKRRNTVIGIKRIGELGVKPFQNACFNRLCSGNWEDKFGNFKEKSFELLSSWSTNVSDPAWHPFKLEVINGKQMEVIDEDDQKLKELREEWGEEAYKGVTEALIGLNQYNASGRYPVSELWNYKQDRIATLEEVIQYVFKRWGAKMKKTGQ